MAHLADVVPVAHVIENQDLRFCGNFSPFRGGLDSFPPVQMYVAAATDAHSRAPFARGIRPRRHSFLTQMPAPLAPAGKPVKETYDVLRILGFNRLGTVHFLRRRTKSFEFFFDVLRLAHAASRLGSNRCRHCSLFFAVEQSPERLMSMFCGEHMRPGLWRGASATVHRTAVCSCLAPFRHRSAEGGSIVARSQSLKCTTCAELVGSHYSSNR